MIVKMIYNYGYMILPKGTILYHMNDNKEFIYKSENEKPFLFCAYHPSEYIGFKYIHFIKLKKKIKLLFMIDDIIKNKIYSALPNIIKNHPKLNLSKLNSNVLYDMREILETNNLEGWFTSVENKGYVETAFLNKPEIFKCIGSMKFNKKWNNSNYNNNKAISKRWNDFYEKSFIEKPIKLYLHKRFKKKIKDYKKYEKKSKFIHEYIFQMMLDYIKIRYYE